MNSKIVKQFLKETIGLKTVKVSTIPCKAKWIQSYIPCENAVGDHGPLRFLEEYPADFRKLCLRVVYPTSPSMHEQTAGGNIQSHRLDMLPHEWDTVINEWKATHPEAV